jgi:hypothetical protein
MKEYHELMFFSGVTKGSSQMLCGKARSLSAPQN